MVRYRVFAWYGLISFFLAQFYMFPWAASEPILSGGWALAFASSLSTMLFMLATFVVLEFSLLGGEPIGVAARRYAPAVVAAVVTSGLIVVEALAGTDAVLATIVYTVFFVLLVYAVYRRVGGLRGVLAGVGVFAAMMLLYAVGDRVSEWLFRAGVPVFFSVWAYLYREPVVSGEVFGGASIVHVVLATVFGLALERVGEELGLRGAGA